VKLILLCCAEAATVAASMNPNVRNLPRRGEVFMGFER
jgi:hypothetical protein